MNSAFPSAAAQIPAAIDTVRRFFDGINHETDTGDEAPAIATFDTACSLCGSEVFSIHNELAGGNKIEGGHLHVVAINSAVATAERIVTVMVTETEDGGKLLGADAKVLRSFDPAAPAKLAFQVEVGAASTKILQIDRAG